MSWFDNAAKSAARRSAGSDDVVESSSGLTRRDALKKAGIVGGAALWMTPMLQSVAVATHTGSPPIVHQPGLDAGAACTVGTDCVTGDCTGSVCQPTNAGGTCGTSGSAGTNCTTTVCTNGVCAKSGAGGPCEPGVGADCTTGTCKNNGTCQTSNAGEPCATPADCTGNPQTVTCSGTPSVCG